MGTFYISIGVGQPGSEVVCHPPRRCSVKWQSTMGGRAGCVQRRSQTVRAGLPSSGHLGFVGGSSLLRHCTAEVVSLKYAIRTTAAYQTWSARRPVIAQPLPSMQPVENQAAAHILASSAPHHISHLPPATALFMSKQQHAHCSQARPIVQVWRWVCRVAAPGNPHSMQ
jgi:hypothetical protein